MYLRFNPGDIVRDVNQCGDVDSELSEYRADNIKVEDVRLGPFFGQTLDRLRMAHR
jgi:hypothetical protein